MDKGNKKRIGLQILKIIAIILIIFNHTGENGFELFRCAESRILIYVSLFLDCICKAGVPLFFMISGALLLEKEESIKEIFVKRILRYLIILILFSFIYYLRLYIKNPEYGFSIVYFFKYIYSTPFITPFWFLYLYIEFLVILPVLRAIAKGLDEKVYIYLIILSIVLCYIVVPERIFGLNHINFSLGLMELFIFYPIIGYGIANKLSSKYFNNSLLYTSIGITAVNYLLSVYMNNLEYLSTGEISGTYIDSFSLVPSIAIFYFVIYFSEKKNTIQLSSKLSYIVSYIGGCTLVIYLFEEMLRCDLFIHVFSITDNQILRLIICIPYTIAIIISGVIIAAVIRKIPIFNRLKL